MSEDRLLRLPEVLKLTGLSRSSLYLLIKAGDFPCQVAIGRSVTFSALAVQAWIAKRIDQSQNVDRARSAKRAALTATA